MDKKDSRDAKTHNVTEAQINIAWLLRKSPWLSPIPGTSSLKHFEENLKSADITLGDSNTQFLE